MLISSPGSFEELIPLAKVKAESESYSTKSITFSRKVTC
jgi:hypothetical protein